MGKLEQMAAKVAKQLKPAVKQAEDTTPTASRDIYGTVTEIVSSPARVDATKAATETDADSESTDGGATSSAESTAAMALKVKVLLDGADTPSPATANVTVRVGDRVMCHIVQRKVSVVSNASSPTVDVKTAQERIDESNADARRVATDYLSTDEFSLYHIHPDYDSSKSPNHGVILSHESFTESVYYWKPAVVLLDNGAMIVNESGGQYAESPYFYPGRGSFTEGEYCKATKAGAHAEGQGCSAIGGGAHAEGMSCIAGNERFDVCCHAEGRETAASGGDGSHSEGGYTLASGNSSHAEGVLTVASNDNSHAEGDGTTASGKNSHSEGEATHAKGYVSHSEGYYTHAIGDFSHAEGLSTEAHGVAAHAAGEFTIAISNGDFRCESYLYPQAVYGRYNAIDGVYDEESKTYTPNKTYAFIVGNGTDEDHRSNAFAVKWDGTIECATVDAILASLSAIEARLAALEAGGTPQPATSPVTYSRLEGMTYDQIQGYTYDELEGEL